MQTNNRRRADFGLGPLYYYGSSFRQLLSLSRFFKSPRIIACLCYTDRIRSGFFFLRAWNDGVARVAALTSARLARKGANSRGDGVVVAFDG